MVCIEKRPYTLYGRLATLHFRYLTCLLDRGHINHLKNQLSSSHTYKEYAHSQRLLHIPSLILHQMSLFLKKSHTCMAFIDIN